MPVVIDASVAAAWCFPDEESGIARHASTVLTHDIGVVPFIFWYEICNILIQGERRQRTDMRRSGLFLERLHNLPIQTDHDHDIYAIMRLARKHRLTGYDAAYLETALRRNAPLATLDQALRAAAIAEGVALV